MTNYRLGICVYVPLIVLRITLCGTVVAAAPSLQVERMRCEYLTNPLGIDCTEPRLSWNVVAEDATARGLAQSAYQILVASSADRLARDDGDLWDSGRVASDKSIQVAYAGRALTSRQECYWKIRIWDQDGTPSAWSAPAHWTMGLLEASDWHAKWIGLDGDLPAAALADTNWIWYPEGEANRAVPAGVRYFRRTFELPADRRIKRAELQATVDNEMVATVNGRDVGIQNDYRSACVVDLTQRLKAGKNLIAVTATNREPDSNPAGLVGKLTIEFDAGPPLVIVTDDQWRSSSETSAGWNTDAEFDDSSWKPAQVVGPVGMQPWGEVLAAEDRRLPARYVRKEFHVDKPVRRATVSMSGLGLSELYLNGKKVGDEVLSPGSAEYPKREFYVTHDVTNELRSGANAVGVILGNGRFYSMRGRANWGMPHYGYPKLLLNLHIEYDDGSVADIVSDGTWKITDAGPIRANNEYDGEEYDARREMFGWSEAGFDDSAWQSAELVDAPGGVVAAQMIEPIRVVETLRPVKITEPSPGVYIFDMGQNMVGWCRLKVAGPAGTTVSLRHAETLKPDGTLYLANLRGAKVTDKYTLRGEGEETWEPRFTYHGFRFVEVIGYPGKPTLDSLTGCVVHDDLARSGQFACSNELINQIYKNIVWGTRGNYRSIPTDCPQRDERQGWLGDRSEESMGESYIFDIAALYSKWLTDMEDAQRASGSIPDVCPAHWPFYSDNVTWPSSSIIIPNMLYRQYGDVRIIARHYNSAKRWIDYMGGFVQDGIIERDSYGDWCVPPEDPKLIHSQDPARITNKALLATSYFYHDLRLMGQYATMLDKQEDAREFSRRADELADAFNRRFLKHDLGQYDNGTQTSCVLPLRFGLVPAADRQPVFEHLVDKIERETHGHIGTGLIGGQYLNRVLSDHGRADLSYTIASQSDYPSWGYMVREGATTIWELWNGNTADPAMNSHNHVMLVGDLVIWLYEYLAGIAPDDANPGFKHLVMRPQRVDGLDWVKVSYLSPYGMIRSQWQQDGEKFDWRVSLPANTSATIYVPAEDADHVTEGGTPAASADGVKAVGYDAGRAVYEVSSGDYHFVSE